MSTGSRVCPKCSRPFSPSESRPDCPACGVLLVSFDDDLLGAVIDEKYKLVSRLGDGGWGSVYVARHQNLGVSFAVKFLDPRLCRNIRNIERFEQEARNLARLDHPGVVKVLDFGLQPRPYIVMEYVEGQTLAEFVAASEGRLPAEVLLPFATELFAVLHYAHSQGVMHLDLTPKNILLTGSAGGRRQVKLLDFGMSKLVSTVSDTPDSAPEMMSSLPFMSPERFSGVSSAAADIYASGCILFEMIVGRVPFHAADAAEWRAVHTKEMPALHPDDSRLAEPGKSILKLALSCMSKDPSTRPQAIQCLNSLSHLHDAAALANKDNGVSSSGRKTFVISSVAVLCVLVAGFFLFNSFFRGTEKVAPPRAMPDNAKTPYIETMEPGAKAVELVRTSFKFNFRKGEPECAVDEIVARDGSPESTVVVLSRPGTKLQALAACFDGWAASGFRVLCVSLSSKLGDGRDYESFLSSLMDLPAQRAELENGVGLVICEQDLQSVLEFAAINVQHTKRVFVSHLKGVVVINPTCDGKWSLDGKTLHDVKHPMFYVLDGAWKGNNRSDVSRRLEEAFTYGVGKQILYQSSRVSLKNADDGEADQSVLRSMLGGFLSASLLDDKARGSYLYSQKSVQAVGSAATFKMRQ